MKSVVFVDDYLELESELMKQLQLLLLDVMSYDLMKQFDVVGVLELMLVFESVDFVAIVVDYSQLCDDCCMVEI